MAKKATKRSEGINLLTAGDDQAALRFAGAGSLSDYAKMAHAEGGSLLVTPEDAVNMGAGFVQDLMRMQAAEEDGGTPGGSGEAPVLTSLSPNTAVLGSADLTLVCNGSGFTEDTRINFAGQEENTTLVSDTQVSTGVKPSLGWGVVSVPVYVTNGGLMSEVLQFTFTEAVSRSKK
jgi:hypothetical protein